MSSVRHYTGSTFAVKYKQNSDTCLLYWWLIALCKSALLTEFYNYIYSFNYIYN